MVSSVRRFPDTRAVWRDVSGKGSTRWSTRLTIHGAPPRYRATMNPRTTSAPIVSRRRSTRSRVRARVTVLRGPVWQTKTRPRGARRHGRDDPAYRRLRAPGYWTLVGRDARTLDRRPG